MEYPGSHFNRIYRRIFLAFFITAFFVIAPLLVFYTAGYRYDFQNGIVQEIGAISIDILPTNTIAYLNNTKIDSKMPIRLKNVAPGKYKIKITANGFYDWEKEVAVVSKQTVYIKEVQLIKKSDPQKIVDGQIGNISYSNPLGGKFLIYQKINSSEQEFDLYDQTNNQSTKIFSTNKNSKYQIQWTGYSDYAMFFNDELSDVRVLNASNGTSSLWSFDKNETGIITKIQWGTENNDIYYSTKSKLAVINAISQNKTDVSKNSDAYNWTKNIDWLEDGGKIWTLTTTSTLNQLVVTKDTFGFSEDVFSINNTNNGERADSWKILKIAGNQILMKNNDQKTMLLSATDKQYNIYGENFLNSPYNNWWIMWTPWELTTYSQGEEPFLLNRSGEQLRKVVVLDKYNTLGLIWADKMTALFPYYFVSHNLINSSINDAAADSENRVLYFSAKLNGQDGLWKMSY